MEEEDFVEEQGTDTRIQVNSIDLLASIFYAPAHWGECVD